MKSMVFMIFVANFRPFILCNDCTKPAAFSAMLVAEWKNYRPSAFRVSATPARETIQANCPA
jgi:hypothetical protein